MHGAHGGPDPGGYKETKRGHLTGRGFIFIGSFGKGKSNAGYRARRGNGGKGRLGSFDTICLASFLGV
jgi:hypothetical protein